MIARDSYLSRLEKWKDKPVVKVITGIRRCGKSTLLKMFRNRLCDSGIMEEQIHSLNLEDIDNEKYLNYRELYSFIKEKIHPTKMNYLFFDEIQMVDNFQRTIDSLQLIDNVDIYVTGSNAYLLSGEIATLLSGRYVEIQMYPLSFKEFSSILPSNINNETAYRTFIEYGAFPYITQLSNDSELIKDYLRGLYNTIVLKDVIYRKKISDVVILENIVKFLSDNIGNTSAIKRISDTLTSAGRKTSSHTVESYISALIASYIFYPVSRYDVKGTQLLKTGQKYYLADIGLRNIILGSKGGDLGHILENIIFLELLRRVKEVYIGKVGTLEIDFIAIDGNTKSYYQVALSVRDEKTLQRELAPLQAINDSYPKYLITLDNDPIISHNGINQIYALDWLLNE